MLRQIDRKEINVVQGKESPQEAQADKAANTAKIFENEGKYTCAAEIYEHAADLTSDKEKKVQYLTKAKKNYLKDGKSEEADRIDEKLKFPQTPFFAMFFIPRNGQASNAQPEVTPEEWRKGAIKHIENGDYEVANIFLSQAKKLYAEKWQRLETAAMYKEAAELAKDNEWKAKWLAEAGENYAETKRFWLAGKRYDEAIRLTSDEELKAKWGKEKEDCERREE